MKINNLVFNLFAALILSGGASPSVAQTQIVYTTDQNSNTVTVIDATGQQVIGQIVLGYPATDPRLFSPLYNGDINVHGINYDPINQKIAVVSTVSNSVTILDAQTGRVLTRAYVGRNPHEPRYTTDGKELWITVRGENYVSVLDALTLKEKQRIVLSEGPGMLAFSADGTTAFICSSFDDNFWVVNVKSKKIIKTLKVPSRFSPFVNVTPDGKEVWVAHKDVGMATRIDAKTYTIIESFSTGKLTNHIGFAGKFFYATVGGENKVKVYTISDQNKAVLTKEIPTDELPHGIWSDATQKEIYVVAELANTFHIIDVESGTIKKTLPIGQRPQALIPVLLKGDVNTLKQYLESNRPVFKGPQK